MINEVDLLILSGSSPSSGRRESLFPISACWNDMIRDTPTPTVTPPDPLSINFIKDTAHTINQMVRIYGSVIEATGINGIKYRLDIPDKALLSLLNITLVPISKAIGFPFDHNLSAGILIEPWDLRFIRSATLTIENVTPATSPGFLVGFHSKGDGEDLNLVPMQIESNKVIFSIMQLGLWGVTETTVENRDIFANRYPPEDAESQAMQQLSGLKQRLCECGPDEEALSRIQQELQIWHDQSIKPDLTQALSDDRFVPKAVAHYLSWKNEIKQERVEDRFITDVASADITMASAVRRALHSAIVNSASSSSVIEDVTFLRWYVFSRLMELDAHYPEMDFAPDLKQVVKRARYQMAFNAYSRYEQDDKVKEEWMSIQAAVLSVTDTAPWFQGKGQIEVGESVYHKDSHCTGGGGGWAPAFLHVEDGLFNLNLGLALQSSQSWLLYTVDQYDYIYSYLCQPGPPYQPITSVASTLYYSNLHQDELTHEGYVAAGWQIKNEGLEKRYDRAISFPGYSYPIIENSLFTIQRLPGL